LAEECLRESIAIHEKLAAGYPTEYLFRHAVAEGTHSLGELLLATNRLDDAAIEFQKYIDLIETLAEEFPKFVDLPHEASKFYYGCRDSRFHDPALAVEWAKKALALLRDRPEYLAHLGAAYYRNREWALSFEALDAAVRLMKSPSPCELYWLAMAQFQNGLVESAERTIERAEQLQARLDYEHADVPLLRAEAMALIRK
jgi:tetratricopeptide (TPR) repeat protein